MRRLIYPLAVATLALASCGGGDHTVGLKSNFRYEPGTLEVNVGETVTFVNDSDASHTVTAYQDKIPEGGSFFSSGSYSSEQEARNNPTDGMLMNGESFDVSFEKPGTYYFFCVPHEKMGMKGKIVVEGD